DEDVSVMTKTAGSPPARAPAVIEDRFGERSHQPDRPAAVDQADAVLGQNSAELCRRVHESWVVAGAGGAIDANRFDCAHGQWMWPEPSGPSSCGLGAAVLERVTRGLDHASRVYPTCPLKMPEIG